MQIVGFLVQRFISNNRVAINLELDVLKKLKNICLALIDIDLSVKVVHSVKSSILFLGSGCIWGGGGFFREYFIYTSYLVQQRERFVSFVAHHTPETEIVCFLMHRLIFKLTPRDRESLKHVMLLSIILI